MSELQQDQPPSTKSPTLAGLRTWIVCAAGLVVLCVAVLVAGGVGLAFVLLKPATDSAGSRNGETPEVLRGNSGSRLLVGNDQQPNPVLETLGSLTAVHLYQTYLNLGFLADGVEYDAYTQADAKALLAAIVDMIDNVDQQLRRLGADGLGPEDRENLGKVRSLIGLLRAQASELRAYWDTPETDSKAKKEHEANFHAARKKAWTGIQQLLNVENQSE